MNRVCFAILYSAFLLLSGCAQRQLDLSKPSTAATLSEGASRQKVDPHPSLLAGCHRIVFVGDSITYSGQFVDDIDMVLRKSVPEGNFEFLNLGLPSETVSGLSEPGHAGGSFPRPNLHDRLERLLELTRPDLVIACYGMNDGIYYPFDPARFEKFQDGIRLLRNRVTSRGAKLIIVTPPVFDPLPIRGNTLPAGLAEYRKPYEGYNGVLDQYSLWLLDQRASGWTVIDAHSPMVNYIAERRRKDAKFVLANDGVHLNDTGHWLIAQAILHGLKVTITDSSAIMDLSAGKAGAKGDIRDIQKQEGGFRFTWRTRPPLPMAGSRLEATFRTTTTSFPPQGEIHNLIALRPAASSYRLFENDEVLGTVSREDLEKGVDTRQFSRLTSTQRGLEILKLIHSRNHILSDAWLTAVGHARPGMSKGLPVDEASAQATKLDQQIKELSQSVDLHLRLEPVPATQ